MRKVVTGEQVAQLHNHDPFAVPLWRAPVYRTPFVFVAIVQAARLMARLVRFLARHPAGTVSVVVTVLLWRAIGWAGLTALAVSVAALLAVWRRRFPTSFSQRIVAPWRSHIRA
jgi:hypothetical protein